MSEDITDLSRDRCTSVYSVQGLRCASCCSWPSCAFIPVTSGEAIAFLSWNSSINEFHSHWITISSHLHIKQHTGAGISVLMALWMTSWVGIIFYRAKIICITVVPHLVQKNIWFVWQQVLRGDFVLNLMMVFLIEVFGCSSLSLSVNKHSLFWTYCLFLFCVVCCCKCCCCLHYLSYLLLSCFCVEKGSSVWKTETSSLHPSSRTVLFILNILFKSLMNLLGQKHVVRKRTCSSAIEI